MSSPYYSDYDQTQSTDIDADMVQALLKTGPFFGLMTAVFGLVVCFFGLKIFKCLMYVFGFCTGLIVGMGFGVAVESEAVMLLAGLCFGILGGYFAVWCRKVIYLLFGVSLGSTASFALNIFILSRTNNTDDAFETLCLSTIILSIIGGIIAVYIGDLIVIIATASSGAFNVSIGTVALFAANPMKSRNMILIMLELFLFISLGIWYQLRRREEWKGALEVHNTTVTNNNNVDTSTSIDIRVVPTHGQYMSMNSQPYSTPSLIQNPVSQQYAYQSGQDQFNKLPLQQYYSYPQPQYTQPPQYAQSSQYIQMPQYEQRQYAPPQDYIGSI